METFLHYSYSLYFHQIALSISGIANKNYRFNALNTERYITETIVVETHIYMSLKSKFLSDTKYLFKQEDHFFALLKLSRRLKGTSTVTTLSRQSYQEQTNVVPKNYKWLLCYQSPHIATTRIINMVWTHLQMKILYINTPLTLQSHILNNI